MNWKAQEKLTIGLTGGILCGKSTALLAWKSVGAYVLSCDALLREISSRPAIQKKLLAVFGTVDRAALADRVFVSAPLRKKLEGILHPVLLKEISKRLRIAKQRVRVVEVPLLFEAKLEHAFDLTVALVSGEKKRSARAKKRQMSQTDFLRRSHTQLPLIEKAARADICITNDGTGQALHQKIKELHRALCEIYQVK